MEQKQPMQEALNDIKAYFNNWLTQSKLTEDTFLRFRTCKKYKLSVKECIQNEKEGIAVFITHDKEEPIGLPFWIGYDNTLFEKEQYFLNTALVLVYLAGLLDKKNQTDPVSGSYMGGYFMLKTRNFLPQFMEYKERLFVDQSNL